MMNFFSKYKIIFYFVNFFLIFLNLFPGSLLGYVIYKDINTQPQITSNFIISSNHFYSFVLISVIGFLTFIRLKQNKYLIIYLFQIQRIIIKDQKAMLLKSGLTQFIMKFCDNTAFPIKSKNITKIYFIFILPPSFGAAERT